MLPGNDYIFITCRDLFICQMEHEMMTRLFKAQTLSGGDLGRRFDKAMHTMGVRARHAGIYREALELHKSNPETVTFGKLADYIGREILGICPNQFKDLGWLSLNKMIEDSGAAEYVVGQIAAQLFVINYIAEERKLSFYDAMDVVDIPLYIDSVYEDVLTAFFAQDEETGGFKQFQPALAAEEVMRIVRG